jgi:hypothetical protein
MVAPLLEGVTSQPALMDPAHTLAAAAAAPPAPGAPGALASRPHVAAAAATLQLRLLEAMFFLPGAHTFAGCHAALLQLCCRQLQGGGAARVLPDAAAAVAATSLKHMLCGQDALLGPWLPAHELLEDELRTFAGEGALLQGCERQG